MLSVTKCIILFLLSMHASALATPRLAHRRHALSVRDAIPIAREPVAVNTPRQVESRKVRAVRRKSCRPRPVSSSISTNAAKTSSSSTPVATSSKVAVVGNLGEGTTSEAAPTTSSAHTSTHTSTQDRTTTKVAETTTKAAETTTKTSSAAQSTSTSTLSYLSGVQTGQGTYYGTGLGACGITNNDSQDIVAVSHLLFDSYPGYNGVNPNDNPVCGKKITANYEGKSVTVTVTDRCVGCALTSLDFSPNAFSQLADESIGRLYGVTWTWDD